jgi:hypothetical protein
VSEQPRLNRPQYLGDKANVLGLAFVGDRVVVAGTGITQIKNGDGSTRRGSNLSVTAPRDPTRVTWAAPVANSAWWAVRSYDGDVIAVGNDGAWRFDLGSRRVVWHRRLDGVASTVSRIPGSKLVIVGGSFKGGLTALNAETGRVAHYAMPTVRGKPPVPNAGHSKVYRGAVSPTGRYYALVGTFTRVGARAREQAAVLRLRRHRASVTAWNPPVLQRDPDGDGYVCGAKWPAFLRGVDWSADGSWFVTGSSGGPAGPPCDTVMQWTVSRQTPVWNSPTCRDTIHSVHVIDGGRIMVGGHFKCIGTEEGAPGSPSQRPRFGIAMLNPNGTVNRWRSDKCRGVGARVIAELPGGIGVGYDCGYWGNSENENPDPTPQFPRSGFAFLPQR